MADMLQRMKTVAEDDCFQDAVDAENEEGESMMITSLHAWPRVHLQS